MATTGCWLHCPRTCWSCDAQFDRKGYSSMYVSTVRQNRSQRLILCWFGSLLSGWLALGSEWVSAQPIQSVAGFSSVVSRDGGEHCHGYSVSLWRSPRGMFGLLEEQAGLCGDPPCGVIRNVRLEAESGALEFRADLRGQPIRFKGTMTGRSLKGTLGSEPVSLARVSDKDVAGPVYKSLRQWCEVWQTIPRCGGVRQFCESQGASGPVPTR